jgi:hypothetical protein
LGGGSISATAGLEIDPLWISNMVRLTTRLDKDRGIYLWKIEDSEQEYEKLFNLLHEYNLIFSTASSVVVKIIRAGIVIAKLNYSAGYCPLTNTISLYGLLGMYCGPVMDTLIRFGNEHIGYADKFQAQAVFCKYYRAETEESDSDSDSESESESEN